MRVAIELNGVLRDTLKKIQQEYEKWYLENPFKEDEEKSDYDVISDLTTLDISKHLNLETMMNYTTFYIKNILWKFLVMQAQLKLQVLWILMNFIWI